MTAHSLTKIGCSGFLIAMTISAMKRVAELSLVGLLIVASGGVAVSAEAGHDFGKWEKGIAAYEQMDRTNPPPKSAVLFIGASTIARWKTLAQDFPEQRVINRGFGGSQIADSTHFAKRIIFPPLFRNPSSIFSRIKTTSFLIWQP